MRKFAIALAILAFGLVSILNLYAASLSSVILPDTARVGTTGAAIEKRDSGKPPKIQQITNGGATTK